MDFPQHSQHVLEQLNQQRQLGLLCDCTFVVDGVDFKAHKAVLAACSEYFKMLFVDQKDVVHLDISNAAGTLLGPGPQHTRPSQASASRPCPT